MANLTVEEDGGGDYTTLDEACDNIGAGETITIQGAWDNSDTRNVIVSTDCTITVDSSSRVTTAGHVSGTPTHYRLQCATNGSHCITVNDSATSIDGIEIKQGSTGASDECIRMAHSGGTLTVERCILWSGHGADDQDGVHSANISFTITLKNCIIYNFERAGVLEGSYSGSGYTTTHHINSCGFYLCGEDNELYAGGISIGNDRSGTYNVNVLNTWIIDCNFNQCDDYNEKASGGTVNWGISYSIDSDNSIASRDGGGAGNQASRAIAASDQGAGSYVIVQELTAVPYDLSLRDLGNAKNNAQDEHAVGTAESLTIPNTDIDGTSRPQNTNYDVGAFEIVAAGGNAPTGVLQGSLVGSLGGPI